MWGRKQQQRLIVAMPMRWMGRKSERWWWMNFTYARCRPLLIIGSREGEKLGALDSRWACGKIRVEIAQRTDQTQTGAANQSQWLKFLFTRVACRCWLRRNYYRNYLSNYSRSQPNNSHVKRKLPVHLKTLIFYGATVALFVGSGLAKCV